MARFCIFCGEGKPTREHVVPAWLSDVLPGDGDFTFTRQQEDGSVTSWSTSALNLTVKRAVEPDGARPAVGNGTWGTAHRV